LRSNEPTALRADALEGAAFLAYRTGDRPTARRLAEERIAILRALGDDIDAGKGLVVLANIVAEEELETAEHLWRESVGLLGDDGYTRYAFSGLGLTAHSRGEHGVALEWHERSLEVARRVRDARMMVSTLGAIAIVQLDAGRPAAAVAPLRESLDLALEVHETEALARNGLIGSAMLLASEHPREAIVLVAASVAALEKMHSVLIALQEQQRSEALELARSRVTDAVAGQAWSEGTLLEPEAAARLALAHLD
jgi:tetratricopeptide (TPR) repeat protein